MGRDVLDERGARPHSDFNPRAPYGARRTRHIFTITFTDFNPRAPYGARPIITAFVIPWINFNPRAPYGARRRSGASPPASRSFQSTRPVWGATTPQYIRYYTGKGISIHAPRMGRDLIIGADIAPPVYFNPRAPYGARLRDFARFRELFNFNPRAPYGARLNRRAGVLTRGLISIHAPRMGRDVVNFAVRMRDELFQSTRPVWGATHPQRVLHRQRVISIHAPRMGRDALSLKNTEVIKMISIHAPRMGRDASFMSINNSWHMISIHAPRMGRDDQ